MNEVTSPSSKNLQEILARISEDLNRNITPDEIDQLHQKFDIIERFAGLRSGHDVDHDSGGGVGHHIHHHSCHDQHNNHHIHYGPYFKCACLGRLLHACTSVGPCI